MTDTKSPPVRRKRVCIERAPDNSWARYAWILEAAGTRHEPLARP